MTCFPSLDEFRAASPAGRLVPVARRLMSDAFTPVSAFGRLDDGVSACLFESVVGGEKVGRYSFIAWSPFLWFEARRDEVTVVRGDRREASTSENPFEALRDLVGEFAAVDAPDLPPFIGGAIGYAGYDSVRYVERLPNAPPDDRELPDMAFGFFDQMVVFDNVQKTMTIVAMARCDEQEDVEAAYAEAVGRVDATVRRLFQPAPAAEPADIALGGDHSLEFEANFTQAGFEEVVRRCVEYIRAGDIFQVVVSQRLKTKLAAPPLEVYRTLRVINPSPFMFYLRTPDCTLVGSSPEVMVRVVSGVVTVRPLAGTRRRGATDEEDRALAAELLADPKERAEHVMLVDLGRNDVGRVARYGTVELSDVMTIERYSHVMHISSNVQGELAEPKDAFDALAACLPAGTVSGAPKVRAMEIIDEMEPHRRGPYAGAVGYIDFRGNMDTCIALRTIVVTGDAAYVQAGAGIVADSVPEQEYQETLNKARGLLKAIEATERRIAEVP